jgi:2-keto-4-pentenoate hydratase/2-oxohepta-3-ene-1,7-dioic acid hydratase in catechol pathway
MRLISFATPDGGHRAGVVQGEVVSDTGIGMRELLARGSADPPVVEELPLADVRLLPSVVDPGKIACIGRNYRGHAAEQDAEAPVEPLVFAKFASSLIAHGEPVRLPPLTAQPDYEAELAAVIGTPVRDASEAQALAAVAGYTILNDVTARDLQRTDGQWTRAKSLDTFGPLGPAIVTADEVGDPQSLTVRCFLNGELVQEASTADMIHSVARLAAYLSRAFTLLPGDIVATGTPSGVGAFRTPPRFLRPGDVVRCEIEPIGALENPVVAG